MHPYIVALGINQNSYAFHFLDLKSTSDSFHLMPGFHLIPSTNRSLVESFPTVS